MIGSESVGKCDESDRKYKKATENDERRLLVSEGELKDAARE